MPRNWSHSAKESRLVEPRFESWKSSTSNVVVTLVCDAEEDVVEAEVVVVADHMAVVAGDHMAVEAVTSTVADMVAAVAAAAVVDTVVNNVIPVTTREVRTVMTAEVEIEVVVDTTVIMMDGRAFQNVAEGTVTSSCF
mmetsp:Transcript_25568/g.60260  ORF Transcript_25568/g.60260 Transcript_25568/m.60260 type:complete len:138 (-) Transcript_25568:362-775(-)